jgi:MacB-like protein
MWDQMQRNVTAALRQLAHAPMLTLAATITLALGIGANTAIFSLFDAIAFRPLPVSQPERLVLLGATGPNGARDSFSYPAFQQLERASGASAAVSVFAHAGLGVADITIDGEPERHIRDGALVSGNYFASLGVTPVEGRPILASDDSPSAGAAVVVISQRLRATRFGAAPDIIGRRLTVNTATFTIVGVAPASFVGTAVGDVVDLWIPLQALPRIRASPGRPDLLHDDNASWLTVMGRLAPAASAQDAQPQLQHALDTYAMASGLDRDTAAAERGRDARAARAGAVGGGSASSMAQPTRLVVRDGSLRIALDIQRHLHRADGARQPAPVDRLRERRQSLRRPRGVATT